jgi:hypothetical protein
MERTEQAADEVCGYCGKAEVDDVKLKKCACNLEKYCSVECQKNHRSQHKKECKKRMAEVRDDNLFKQPDESYLGECPICLLPLPIDESKSVLNSCCFKAICKGCDYANKRREIKQGLDQRCAFCREPMPKTDEEIDQNAMKRVKGSAICEMAKQRYHDGDCEGAFQYYTKSAELGLSDAHFNLSCLYRRGKGVEKDHKKEVYHLEVAAIGGHPRARFNLGNREGRDGRHDRAVKHYVIAAKLGCDEALEVVKKGFMMGLVSKEHYAAALRGHQAAVDATKSEQRDAAYAFFNRRAS